MNNYTNKRVSKSLREISVKQKEKGSKCKSEDRFVKPVYVFDENENLVEEYPSNKECCEALGFPDGNLLHYIRYQKPINGMYFSYSKTLLINNLLNI